MNKSQMKLSDEYRSVDFGCVHIRWISTEIIAFNLHQIR